MDLPKEGKGRTGRLPGTRLRTALEKERDRTEINNLRLIYRMSVTEIARIVTARYAEQIVEPLEAGLDKEGKRPPRVQVKQVRLELRAAILDYQDERATEIHGKRLEAIRAYESFGRYVMSEYEKSKGDRVITTETESESTEGTVNTTKTVTEPRAVGDKGFVQIGLQCLDRIVELEAVIPPRKLAMTNPEGTEAFKFEGTEEFKRLAALAQELLLPERQIEGERKLPSKEIKENGNKE